MTKGMSRAEQRRLLQRFRVTDGERFRLKHHDPADTAGFERDVAKLKLEAALATLAELQDMLFAQDRWSVLAIFQAMDAAGKDSAIKHVMTGVNPQGCQVHSFKVPSPAELAHDFMWRCLCKLPDRGRIGVFNRSYYEDVLVVRVHPELLQDQRLPPGLAGKRIWDERLHDIRTIERYLARNGTLILKFFLHVSKDEQKRRFLARLDEPEKNWKFSPDDVRERASFREYMRCYEAAIQKTASEQAPWFVVPADHKWFTHLVVSYALIDALSSLGLRYPKVDAKTRRKLLAARRELGL